MNLESLANVGEFVGGVFVVVSLIYLAFQVRQNTKLLRTENYGRVLDRMSTLQSRLAVDPALNHLFVVGAQDPQRLTSAERVRFSWALYEMFGTGEFMFHQSRDKSLPEVVWKRWEATIGWWLSHPGIQEWWNSKPAPLSTDFEAFGEEMIRSKRFDAAAVERWRAFVAGENQGNPPEAAPGG
jgi:hypothetical protein